MRHVSLEPCDTVGRERGREGGKEGRKEGGREGEREGGKEGKKDIQDNLTHAKKTPEEVFDSLPLLHELHTSQGIAPVTPTCCAVCSVLQPPSCVCVRVCVCVCVMCVCTCVYRVLSRNFCFGGGVCMHKR